MQWTYRGDPFTSEMIADYQGFVYLITNTTNGRMYIGKKGFNSLKKKPATKTRKAKRVKTESDWQEYFGSSEELKGDVQELGRENFKREIIHLCKSKSEMNYLELREQMINDVLLKPDLYYNAYIGTRVNRKHLKMDKL